MLRHIRKLAALAALPVAGVLLVACGSSTSSSPSTTASTASTPTAGGSTSGSGAAAWPAACKLVTAADITSIVGTAPTAPPKTDTQTECDYSSPSEYNFVNASVQAEVLAKFFQQDASSAGETEAVSGLGDASYETPVGAQAGGIFVLKGKQSLRIDLYAPVTPATQAQLHQLASAAVGRVG